jgi:hypothetical protein
VVEKRRCPGFGGGSDGRRRWRREPIAPVRGREMRRTENWIEEGRWRSSPREGFGGGGFSGAPVIGYGQEGAGRSVGVMACFTRRGKCGERERKGGVVTSSSLYSRGSGREEGVRVSLGVPRDEGLGDLEA